MPSRTTFKRKPAKRQSAARRPPPRRKTAKVEAPILEESQVDELLLQALETELGGIDVYENAIECAVNEDLREEWEKYLDQTRNHVDVVTRLCEERGLDTGRESPGRLIVRHLGESLVEAMRRARETGTPETAQVVAAECVTLAETKDHLNWELLREVANALPGDEGKVFKEAVDEVEDEEDEHLYHTMGWTREIWLDSLGLPAVLPPPEEKKDVKTMAGAARAKDSRKRMANRR